MIHNKNSQIKRNQSLMKNKLPPLSGQLIHKLNQVTLQVLTLLPLGELLHNLIRVVRLLLLQEHQQLQYIVLDCWVGCWLAVYLVYEKYNIGVLNSRVIYARDFANIYEWIYFTDNSSRKMFNDMAQSYGLSIAPNIIPFNCSNKLTHAVLFAERLPVLFLLPTHAWRISKCDS